jgi:predicted acylesterase/phospholipase RssA
MPKTLRLGFIMGGGVSLGTFSGAALSEAIKQQIVYGQYDTGKKDKDDQPIYAPYDAIEIDVFSGASAGAISLAIMLRILVNPRDKYRFLGYRSYEDLRDALEQKLSKQFKGKLIQLKMQSPEKYEQLLAAQTIQEFQDKVWSKEVDVDRFLGTGYFDKDLTDSPSFMDRGVVDKLGVELFQFKIAAEERLKNRILLGDRVLFGCTLANLSHTLQKSKRTHFNDTQKPSLIQALNDSSVDRIHSELRVFDLNFKAIKENEGRYYPLRWVQYQEGEEVVLQQQDKDKNSYDKEVKSLTTNDVWREMAATAIASAAVPFAFEPVVLNRYRYEFGTEWATELKDKKSYPFTYVDGGLFNNEPVKEAMRLASYIDTTTENKNFERQLIFVDPDVTELENQFKIHAHEKLSIGRSVFSSKTKVSTKSTILRLFSGMTYILSAILNEAQSIEVGKISAILDQFAHRKQMRNFYRSIVKGIPTDAQIIEMRNFAMAELDKVRSKLNLPDNTLQIQHEFLRIIKEEHDFLDNYIPLEDERLLVDEIHKFIYLPTPSQVEHVGYWIFVLSCLNLDIAMNLVGKTSKTKLIPIAPFNFYEEEGEEFKLMPLPGKGMAGFTGFASIEASSYEVTYGKYCARRIFQELNLTESNQQELPLPPRFDYGRFDGVLKSSLRNSIVKRIKEIVPSGFSTIIPFLGGYLKESVQSFVDSNIHGNVRTGSFQFQIRVPSDLYLLKGFLPSGAAANKKSLQAISIHGDYYLITKLLYDFEEEQWKGAHTNFMQNIYIDKSKFFEDIAMLSLELPVMSLDSDAYLSPNPIFVADIRAGLNTTGYKELSAKNWELKSDVQPLDEHLWGKDKWK